MTITIFHYKPQTGNGLECGWCHAQYGWSWEFDDFEKCQLDSDHWKMSWILTVERCSWDFRISTDRDFKHHKICRTLGWGQQSMIRIARLAKTFKNCVSLSSCRHDLKLETNKPVHTWNNRARLYLYLYNCCDWHHQIIQHNVFGQAGTCNDFCKKKKVDVDWFWTWVIHGTLVD